MGRSEIISDDAELKRMFPPKRFSRECIDSALNTAVQWHSCFSMTTRDGRTFLCFFGESALHCLQDTPCREWLSQPEQNWIEKQAGVILEVGSDDPPMWYSDFNELTAAWLELHEICDVRMTEEEQIFTNHYYLDGDDED